MNWIIIFCLSTFGLIMGVLSLKGYTQKIEPVLWILFAVISSLIISKNVDSKIFIHGLIVGLSWGILNCIIQSLFFEKYLQNNSLIGEKFESIDSINPRYFVLITGPIIGAITGLVLGGLSLLSNKLW